MRFINKTLFFLVVLVFPLIVFSQTKHNLNFDDFNPKEQNLPTGWFKWGNFKNLTGEFISDNNSVGKVVSDKEGTFGCITYRIPSNYVGDTIQLSGRIKYENVKGFVGLLMRINGDSNEKSLAFKSMQNLKIRGTSDWKEYSIKLPFPTNAKNIYVGGILGEKGVAWFDDFKVTIDGKDIQTLKETERLTIENYNSYELELALSKTSKQLDLSSEETINNSLDPLITEIGNKKIVAIGESTHGTSEFYQLREVITKRLITEKGFNLVVLENPYDDIEILNKNLNSRPLDSLIRKHLFSIYQTQEMKSFLQWYKDNRTKYKIQFKGCDDSYWSFYELLKDRINPIDDKKLQILLKNLEFNILKSSTASLKKEYKINNLIYNDILSIENYLKSINNLTKPIEEILFNGKNTYVNYVNIKTEKKLQSRDEIMAERISFLAKNPDNKIIVWAHNAHISNEIITDNEIGIMGRNLKKEFNNDYYTIGLTTLKGSYSYMDEKFINGDHIYTEKLKTAQFHKIESYLWENMLSKISSSFFINMSNLKNELGTDKIIGPTKLIGYSEESEEDVYDVPLIKNFDSLIFIEETNSTKLIFE
jgi:erythromycin esterase-like protein